MPDIAKCKGESLEGFICPKRETCYRFTSPSSEYQHYFREMPWFNHDCSYYWEDKHGKNEKPTRK